MVSGKRDIVSHRRTHKEMAKRERCEPPEAQERTTVVEGDA
jgi:hypothetical protein